ncbi:hypothetical protein KIL84_017260 [Mauremys mutica]|uniref:Uncharacterized protein n=1 Tax=Mauremys mutica TaxID=74926 RepID=A0A9D3X503_9SAUR|nr:hypothetical protein KIL84_017260 [Mauremys mutica]
MRGRAAGTGRDRVCGKGRAGTGRDRVCRGGRAAKRSRADGRVAKRSRADGRAAKRGPAKRSRAGRRQAKRGPELGKLQMKAEVTLHVVDEEDLNGITRRVKVHFI